MGGNINAPYFYVCLSQIVQPPSLHVDSFSILYFLSLVVELPHESAAAAVGTDLSSYSIQIWLY